MISRDYTALYSVYCSEGQCAYLFQWIPHRLDIYFTSKPDRRLANSRDSRSSSRNIILKGLEGEERRG